MAADLQPEGTGWGSGGYPSTRQQSQMPRPAASIGATSLSTWVQNPAFLAWHRGEGASLVAFATGVRLHRSRPALRVRSGIGPSRASRELGVGRSTHRKACCEERGRPSSVLSFSERRTARSQEDRSPPMCSLRILFPGPFRSRGQPSRRAPRQTWRADPDPGRLWREARESRPRSRYRISRSLPPYIRRSRAGPSAGAGGENGKVRSLGPLHAGVKKGSKGMRGGVKISEISARAGENVRLGSEGQTRHRRMTNCNFHITVNRQRTRASSNCFRQ
jgi:hypothetical protein